MVHLKILLDSVVAVSIVVFMKILTSISMNYGGLEWYRTLNLPSIVPPSYVFGPVWTALYALIAGAIANVLWHYEVSQIRPLVLVFTIQAILHVSWGYLFFMMRSPQLGFFGIEALWLSILVLVVATYQYSKLSAALLLPYLAWVTYASLISFKIYQLNG